MGDHSTQDPRTPARPGTRITHFEIVSELGRGGMGVVYRARDVQLDREVALKCPWPEQARDPAYRRRFLREARAVARLSHSHIVPLFEAFEEDGLPWISMQLVEGESLRNVLFERGALPVSEILVHAEGLASALETAHSRGVLHRDVNPNNVIVASDGRALLTDFGLARFLAGRSGAAKPMSDSTRSLPITGERMVVGTPGYMAPEQVLGRPVDERTDLFSLGAVIYEMCTGKPAFGGSRAADALNGSLNVEPPPISELNPAIPKPLSQIVETLLAKRPVERYQTASAVLADLRKLSRRSQVEEYVREHPLATPAVRRVGLIASAAVTGIAVLILWFFFIRSDDRLPNSDPSQLLLGQDWNFDPAISPDGSFVVFARGKSGNLNLWTSDLETKRPGTPRQITDFGGIDRSPAWFPDGVEIAFVSDRGGQNDIWKVDRDGGPCSLLISDAQDPAVSPDGERIAFARASHRSSSSRLFVAPVDSPGAALMLTGEGDGEWDHRTPAWAPDGNTVCYAAHDGLWLIEASGKLGARQLTSGNDEEPAWSSDGRFIYFSSYRNGTRALWRVRAKGGEIQRVTGGEGSARRPSLSRDGRRMTYTTSLRSHELRIVDVSTGKITETQLPRSRLESMAALAPDGRGLVFTDGLGPEFNLWFSEIDGTALKPGLPKRLTVSENLESHPTYSRDGRWIAYFVKDDEGRRDIRVTRASGGESFVITTDGRENVVPAWSPDGKMLAFASARDGLRRIWLQDVFDGKPVGPPRRLTSRETVEDAPTFSPDGSHVAFVGFEDNLMEVLIAPLDGISKPRRRTTAANALRVRWTVDPASGREVLIASGRFGSPGYRLKKLELDGGEPVDLTPPVALGEDEEAYPHFDVTPDGRLLVFIHETTQPGDLWVRETTKGGRF